MGRTATITYAQVATAAASLQAAGIKPTARAVRERLGNIGSMGTVHRLVQDWKAEHERQEEAAAANTLPASVQRVLLAFMGEAVAEATLALEAELAELRQENDDLAASNEYVSNGVLELSDELTALQAEQATLRGRAAQMTAELATLRAERDQERQGRAAAERQVAALEVQLAAAASALAEAQQAAAQALAAAQRAREEAAELRGHLGLAALAPAAGNTR